VVSLDTVDLGYCSVSDPDPVGSGFKSPVWIRIRIRNPDPDPAIEIEPFIKLWKAVLIG